MSAPGWGRKGEHEVRTRNTRSGTHVYSSFGPRSVGRGARALLPLVVFFALPLVASGSFVALAMTGHALDLSALIGMPMLTGSVGTNAIVLLDLVQHRRHSAAGAASASQGSKERNREEAAAGTDAVA
jgi:AcrB/AcrD/AcrF family